MSRTYSITDKQVSSIHNGMCSMYRLRDIASDMFKSDSMINQLIDEVFKYIEPVKKELMAKKDEDFDRIFKLAEEYAKQYNLRETRWSIYDIDNFLQSSNVPAFSTITSEFSDNISVVVESNSKYCSWIELWKAVDKLATLTGEHGFGNHVFIEKFVEAKNKPGTYEVWLGS